MNPGATQTTSRRFSDRPCAPDRIRLGERAPTRTRN